MVDGTVPGFPSAISRIVLRRTLPDRVFGNAATTSTCRKRHDGTDLGADQGDQFGLQVLRRDLVALLHHDQTTRQLTLQRVGDPDHRALGDRRMRREHRLDGSGRQSVSGDIDHVVGPPHHEQIPVLIAISAVAGQVVAGIGREIAVHEARVVTPDGRQGAGRQRQPDARSPLPHPPSGDSRHRQGSRCRSRASAPWTSRA